LPDCGEDDASNSSRWGDSVRTIISQLSKPMWTSDVVPGQSIVFGAAPGFRNPIPNRVEAVGDVNLDRFAHGSPVLLIKSQPSPAS
jgi:hypothetical protein